MQGLLRRIFPFALLLLVLDSTGAAEDDGKENFQGSNAVIIVHPGVELESPSRKLLRSIFSMRLNQWPDGSPIEVFVLPDTDAVHQRFAKQVLGIFPYQLRQSWDRGVFSGTGIAPMQVESVEEMYRRVAATPGAIGYLLERLTSSEVRYVEMD